MTLLSWLQGNIYSYGDLFVFWKLHFTVSHNFKIKIGSKSFFFRFFFYKARANMQQAQTSLYRYDKRMVEDINDKTP